MDDDLNTYSEQPVEYTPTAHRSRFLRALLLWLPLLVSAGCLLFAAARPALLGQGIPVTGVDPLAPPTPAANETIEPAPSRQPLAGHELPYKEEAALRLQICTDAFHSFFVLEQIVIRQPDLARSNNLQQDAERAMQDFRDDCQPLGAMPFVPSAYKDVDRWMKLAAAEVTPAAESFVTLLDSGEHQDEAIDHMLRFIEYTRKAQELMDRLERRKQI